MNLMKRTNAARTLALASLAVFSSSFAMTDEPGWYGGLNLGVSMTQIDEDKIRDALQAGGFTTTSMDEDEASYGGKLFGGYRFNRNWSVEGGYFNLGKAGFTADTSPPGSLDGRTKFQGMNIDPVFTTPLTEKFSVLARAGLHYTEARTSYTGSGTVSPPPDRDKGAANYKFGAGLQYEMTSNLDLRFEAERYRIDDAVGNTGDVDLVSLGLVYRFAAAAASRAEPEHTPPPPAAPVLVVVPVPAKTQKYCTILDIEFEINLDEIQREEQERLAVVATFLKKYPDTTAVIQGYSDNVGTAEDNMNLSLRRAESVVKYLVQTYQIAPSRLSAVGYGEGLPVASNDTEEGKRQNRRIKAVIACARDIEGLTVKPARITMALEMEFELNRSEVQPQYRDELAKVAAFLNANPAVTATVEGHTANLQGSPDQGMALSHQRAQNVVNYLVKEFGIPATRLSAEGFGQTRRFAYNTSTEGQQENRRVNIIINYPR